MSNLLESLKPQDRQMEEFMAARRRSPWRDYETAHNGQVFRSVSFTYQESDNRSPGWRSSIFAPSIVVAIGIALTVVITKWAMSLGWK